MNESIVIGKEADAKKGFSSARRNDNRDDKSIQLVRDVSERQLGSLGAVIGDIRRDGGTPSADSIATQLSSMHTTQRAPVLLGLQQTHGNRYVQRVVAGIQAKLVVGQPGDKYEQEADRVAEQVMRMPEPQVEHQSEEEEKKKEEEELIQAKPLADQITPLIQRLVEEEEIEEEEEELIQTKRRTGQTTEVTSDIESYIHPLRGGGQPLPKSVRTFFEPRFGYDFGRIRIHRNPEAAQMARALNAKAFTTGWDIIFGAGQYALQTVVGKKLLAHELTHVVQQVRPQEIDQRYVHRQSEEEEEALQIKAEAALVQRQAEEEEPIQTNLYGVWVQRQLSSEQPAKGWSLRAAVVTVSWSKDFDTLYRRLIAALAAKTAFADLPKKSLWVFGPAVDAFRLITCDEMCAQFKEGDEVRLIVRAWADPTNHELAENALIGMGRVKVGLGSVIEEEASEKLASEPLDYPAIHIRVQQLFTTINRIALSNYSEAIDNLDVGSLAIAAAALERLLLTIDTVKKQIQSRSETEEGRNIVLEEIDIMYQNLKDIVYNNVSLFSYKDKTVVVATPAKKPENLALYVRMETIRILPILHETAQIVSIIQKSDLSFVDIGEAYNLFQLHSTRPINVLFKQVVLSKEGFWDRFQGYNYSVGLSISGVVTKAKSDSNVFGALVDIGDFDINTAIELLSYEAFDWAITDEEAGKVFKMIASADPAGREKIIKLLDSKGYLERLCNNLPWMAVKNLHNTIRDPDVRELLRPHFEEEGGGKSMQKLYEEWILGHIHEGNYVRAFLLTWLQTAHEGLTFGAMGTISEAYDLREQGLISDDEFWAVVGKASGRTAVVMGAVILTGTVAGGFAEGMAGGLGAGVTPAALIGGTVGGATAGVSGKFTEDIYNIAVFDQEGLSAAEDYLCAAGLGGATGLVLSSVAVGGARLSPRSAAKTAKIYADKHPRLNKLYQGSKAAGRNFGESVGSKISIGRKLYAEQWGREGVDIEQLVQQGKVNENVLKKMVIKSWQQSGGNRPVKVVSVKRGTSPKARGYITQEKYLLGKTPEQMEQILGLPKGELTTKGRGAIVMALKQIPRDGQFKLRGYTQLPGGKTFQPGGKYPIGSGAPQWELIEGVPVKTLQTVKPGTAYHPAPSK